MLGIRIISQTPVPNDAIRYHIDYQFADILAPIKDELNDLYWILDEINFHAIANDRTSFNEKEFTENTIACSSHYQLFKGQFLLKFAKFIDSDWGAILGIRECRNFDLYEDANLDFVRKYAEIAFYCIDAAYWEIYAKDENIIDKLAAQFPHHLKCQLKDKNY